MKNNSWGAVGAHGEEHWDSKPLFGYSAVRVVDFIKLLFYPKKWFLYRYLREAYKVWELGDGEKDARAVFRVLDVGAATGSSVIDIARMLPRAQVDGIDVQAHMVEAGQKILKDAELDNRCTLALFDGKVFPCTDASYHAVYTSDVLGHVTDANLFLKEIARVLVPRGALAMFTESLIGKHAFFRKYLWYRGCNTDPHAPFHISLFSKGDIVGMIRDSGFEILGMRTLFWASFFVHPDEAYLALEKETRFPILRFLNRFLYRAKRLFHPISTACAELYGLVECYLVGHKVEAQGYIVLAKKK